MGGVSAHHPADAQSVSDLKARVDAERRGQPFLLFRDADDRQQVFYLEPGLAAATVGRRPPSDLLLDWDDQVSRLHARFQQVEDGWEIVDDGLSSNGTFVNLERVNPRGRLTDGDTLRFGSTTMTFFSPESVQSPKGDTADPLTAVSLSTTQRRVLVALCRPYKGHDSFARP